MGNPLYSRMGSMDQSKKTQIFWNINLNAILDRFLFTHHGINHEDENIAIETVYSLRPKKKSKSWVSMSKFDHPSYLKKL